jgi:hypothetical protein
MLTKRCCDCRQAERAKVGDPVSRHGSRPDQPQLPCSPHIQYGRPALMGPAV